VEILEEEVVVVEVVEVFEVEEVAAEVVDSIENLKVHLKLSSVRTIFFFSHSALFSIHRNWIICPSM
jgi:hypothetical protein